MNAIGLMRSRLAPLQVRTIVFPSKGFKHLVQSILTKQYALTVTLNIVTGVPASSLLREGPFVEKKQKKTKNVRYSVDKVGPPISHLKSLSRQDGPCPNTFTILYVHVNLW